MDRAGEELSDRASLDSDLDLFKPTETDLDFDLLSLGGDSDFFFTGSGELDFDRFLRDSERDLERLPDLGGERFLRAGERERRREGGVLDLVRLRGLLDLECRLRLRTTTERDRVRRLLRVERERERRDLGGGDLLRRDVDRLLERLPPVRLAGDLERRTGRLDLEVERRFLATERDLERRPTAPLRLGERGLECRRLLRGERDREGDRRPPRLGDRDNFLFGERELLRRLGDTDSELLRRLGDLDFLGDLDPFFLGVREREVEREWQISLLKGFGERESDFLLDLGDREGDSCRLFRGVGDRFSLEVDLERVLDRRSFVAAAAAACPGSSLVAPGVGERLALEPDRLTSRPLEGEGDLHVEESRSVSGDF